MAKCVFSWPAQLKKMANLATMLVPTLADINGMP